MISAGKMSYRWSGTFTSVKISDLEVICVALGCEIGELMVPEPENVTRITKDQLAAEAVGQHSPAPTVVPRSRGGRSLPPR